MPELRDSGVVSPSIESAPADARNWNWVDGAPRLWFFAFFSVVPGVLSHILGGLGVFERGAGDPGRSGVGDGDVVLSRARDLSARSPPLVRHFRSVLTAKELLGLKFEMPEMFHPQRVFGLWFS
jgi:hypothetical protein